MGSRRTARRFPGVRIIGATTATTCTALVLAALAGPATAADERTPDRNGEIAAYARYAHGKAPTPAQWQRWRLRVDDSCATGLPGLAQDLFTSPTYDRRNARRTLAKRVTRLYLALQDRHPSKPLVRKGKRSVRRNGWPALVAKVAATRRYSDRVDGICGADTAIASQHRNAWVYTNWSWSGDDFGQNLDQELRVTKRARSSYWATNWRWSGSADGGYLGLQTNGNRLDGTSGDTAIFSLWNAHRAEGSSCDAFAGEGEGLSCRAAHPIATGHWYRLRVWKLDTYQDEGVTYRWWGAWVLDETAGVETPLGKISVPDSLATVTDQSNFSEYFGKPLPHVYDVPRSVVWWTTPAADYDGSGAYAHTSTFASGQVGPGTTGAVSDAEVDLTTPLGDAKAVRVRMGG